MSYNIIVDDLDNAVSGYGQTVDIAAQLGLTATQPVVYGAIVPDSKITAGAVQLQYGTGGAAGITWTSFGSPTSLSANTPATVGPITGVNAQFARFVITTPLAGGKCTGLITV